MCEDVGERVGPLYEKTILILTYVLFLLTILYPAGAIITTCKIVSLVLSALMVLPIGFLSFIVLIFGDIGQNTVVQTVDCPSGEYYAQVINSDQGALGGDTFVDVYKKAE